MPEEASLNWYGSGDINNDHTIDWLDLSRLDSILSGNYSNPGDAKLLDTADINGDQNISSADRSRLADFLEGNINYLPAHWNNLATKNERIDWLEKALVIDQTEEGETSPDYSGDYYTDQLLINFHGFEDAVLHLFSSPPIDYKHNGRFNLPLTYASIFYNRPDLKSNRNLNAIMVGNNVFDWGDWCFIDPEWDQLIFPEGFDEPTGNESFPPLNNWLDDINNITKRDEVAPSINLTLSGDKVTLNNGYIDLGYTLSDPNLKSAYYYLDNPLIKQLIFKDTMTLDESNDKLVPVFNKSGTLYFMLKNGQYQFVVEAQDHFYNKSSREIQLIVNDPPPEISILSPGSDMTYTEDIPLFNYRIEETNFSKAWYTLDSGQTKIPIQQEGTIGLDITNGSYQIIVFAEDEFGNTDTETLTFNVDIQTTTTEFRKDEDSGLLVYPNPVEDNLNILVHLEYLSLIHLSIYDINSRIVWESNPNQTLAINNRYKIDFSSYPAGVYFLRCTLYSDRTVMKMIIKQ